MNTASCLCGAVNWQAEGPYEFMSHCHCSRCRKAHGAAFATYVGVQADHLSLRGEDRIGRWESAPGAFRCFCDRCGSVVPGSAWEGVVFAPAGNFDDDPGARPVAHILVASKAPWYEIPDQLARFDAFPPGVDAALLPDRPPLDPPGKPRGSCLCGAVSYVIEGEPIRAMNCHCTRCRKARSAAHASNLFLAEDGLRFTRGEDHLAKYKVPEARYFQQVFCRTCGSALPRVDHERGIAVVPMGSLDDDPGLHPQGHIYVGSKAPWFEIADQLPQHEEQLR